MCKAMPCMITWNLIYAISPLVEDCGCKPPNRDWDQAEAEANRALAQSLLEEEGEELTVLSPLDGLPISTPMIVGGRNAEPDSWPWQLSLQFDANADTGDSPNFRHTCGAVLYDEWWAVTAAHCVAGE